MEHVTLPTTIEFLDGDKPNVGHVVVTPCQKGYGTTLGNALRRVLLSSLPGAAVESVKINGVQHEFSAVEHLQDDMIEVILNLKQMAVLLHGEETVTLTLSKNSAVEIMNPDLRITAVTDAKKPLEMEVTVGRGAGYVPVAEKDTSGYDLGTIAIDSLYTPIRDVGYNVEATRVGDVTDYEKLTLTIETNGTIAPKDAVSKATRILMDHFTLVAQVAGTAPEDESKSDA